MRTLADPANFVQWCDTNGNPAPGVDPGVCANHMKSWFMIGPHQAEIIVWFFVLGFLTRLLCILAVRLHDRLRVWRHLHQAISAQDGSGDIGGLCDTQEVGRWYGNISAAKKHVANDR